MTYTGGIQLIHLNLQMSDIYNSHIFFTETQNIYILSSSVILLVYTFLSLFE